MFQNIENCAISFRNGNNCSLERKVNEYENVLKKRMKAEGNWT